MMEWIAEWAGWAAGWAWSLPTAIFLLTAGMVFTIGTKFMQFRAFGHAWKVIRGKYDDPDDPGDISHFQALSAALSATIGLGNIAGVAVAISLGGPGAVFWMWIAALVGMCSKYVSCSLSNKYRVIDEEGHAHGGPMYSISNGLGSKWKWLGGIFASFCVVASFGAGNMFQSNQAAVALSHFYSIPKWVTGAVLAFVVALVIIGGIKRIGEVASKIVPFMCVAYTLGAVIILAMHVTELPRLLGLIFTDAFRGAFGSTLDGAVAGGFGWVVRQGVRRALFSNEAGVGSAAIAHAAAKTDYPVREGVVAMVGPFIDTIVICSMTALVILSSGLYGPRTPDLLEEYMHDRGEERTIEEVVSEHGNTWKGVVLTAEAFDHNIPFFGRFVVVLGVALFAFSTAISWSYYGETSLYYLFGKRSTLPYKVIFIVLIMVGANWKLAPVIDISDTLFALMAIPNIFASLLLLPRLRRWTGEYMADLKAGEFKVFK